MGDNGDHVLASPRVGAAIGLFGPPGIGLALMAVAAPHLNLLFWLGFWISILGALGCGWLGYSEILKLSKVGGVIGAMAVLDVLAPIAVLVYFLVPESSGLLSGIKIPYEVSYSLNDIEVKMYPYKPEQESDFVLKAVTAPNFRTGVVHIPKNQTQIKITFVIKNITNHIVHDVRITITSSYSIVPSLPSQNVFSPFQLQTDFARISPFSRNSEETRVESLLNVNFNNGLLFSINIDGSGEEAMSYLGAIKLLQQ